MTFMRRIWASHCSIHSELGIFRMTQAWKPGHRKPCWNHGMPSIPDVQMAKKFTIIITAGMHRLSKCDIHIMRSAIDMNMVMVINAERGIREYDNGSLAFMKLHWYDHCCQQMEIPVEKDNHTKRWEDDIRDQFNAFLMRRCLPLPCKQRLLIARDD